MCSVWPGMAIKMQPALHPWTRRELGRIQYLDLAAPGSSSQRLAVASGTTACRCRRKEHQAKGDGPALFVVLPTTDESHQPNQGEGDAERAWDWNSCLPSKQHAWAGQSVLELHDLGLHLHDRLLSCCLTQLRGRARAVRVLLERCCSVRRGLLRAGRATVTT